MSNQEGAKGTTGLHKNINQRWLSLGKDFAHYPCLRTEIRFLSPNVLLPRPLHVVADLMAGSGLFEFWLEQRVADLR